MDQLNPSSAAWNRTRPSRVEAEAFSGVRSEAVRALLQELMADPADELLKRPSNHFRSMLVRIGAELSDTQKISLHLEHNLEVCAEAVEWLHLGSLIIDDVQDGSAERRGGPAMHKVLGTAQAISIGNWLYFRALRHVDELRVDDETRTQLIDLWHEVMEVAHYGQMLDLSLSIDALPVTQLAEICQQCAYYKTGSVVALAMSMGALVNGASESRLRCIEQLGYNLGVYLQSLNDIGNICGSFDEGRRYEDFMTLKPSFIWAYVSQELDEAALQELLVACEQLPSSEKIDLWLDRYPITESAKLRAEELFEATVGPLLTHAGDLNLKTYRQLKERIRQAYA